MKSIFIILAVSSLFVNCVTPAGSIQRKFKGISKYTFGNWFASLKTEQADEQVAASPELIEIFRHPLEQSLPLLKVAGKMIMKEPLSAADMQFFKSLEQSSSALPNKHDAGLIQEVFLIACRERLMDVVLLLKKGKHVKSITKQHGAIIGIYNNDLELLKELMKEKGTSTLMVLKAIIQLNAKEIFDHFFKSFKIKLSEKQWYDLIKTALIFNNYAFAFALKSNLKASKTSNSPFILAGEACPYKNVILYLLSILDETGLNFDLKSSMEVPYEVQAWLALGRECDPVKSDQLAKMIYVLRGHHQCLSLFKKNSFELIEKVIVSSDFYLRNHGHAQYLIHSSMKKFPIKLIMQMYYFKANINLDKFRSIQFFNDYSINTERNFPFFYSGDVQSYHEFLKPFIKQNIINRSSVKMFFDFFPIEYNYYESISIIQQLKRPQTPEEDYSRALEPTVQIIDTDSEVASSKGYSQDAEYADADPAFSEYARSIASDEYKNIFSDEDDFRLDEDEFSYETEDDDAVIIKNYQNNDQ